VLAVESLPPAAASLLDLVWHAPIMSAMARIANNFFMTISVGLNDDLKKMSCRPQHDHACS